ncbi:MAG TPA: hypothetical protein VF532_08245 [Candidatus Angelobacter sp.]
MSTGAVFEICGARGDLETMFGVQAVEADGDGGLGKGGSGDEEKKQ